MWHQILVIVRQDPTFQEQPLFRLFKGLQDECLIIWKKEKAWGSTCTCEKVMYRLNVVEGNKWLKQILLFDSGPAPDISKNFSLVLYNCYTNVGSIFKLINAFVRVLLHEDLQIDHMNYISVFFHCLFFLIYLICSLFHRVKHWAQAHQYYVD